MLNKKIIILTIILACILSISAVSATNNLTDEIVGIDNCNNQIANIDDSSRNIISIENNNQTNEPNNDILSTQEDNILSTEDGNYGQLVNKINNAESGSTVTLTQNYIYQNISSDTPYINGIPINKPLTIEGNGIIIDANNKAGFFNITSDNVIINNITFKNAKNTAINWNGNNGILNNTIFTSNNERLINWEGNNNAILNSIFTGNQYNKGDSSSSTQLPTINNYGFVYLNGNDNLVHNSDFNNNSISYYGWFGGSNLYYYGTAISIVGDNAKVNSSNFNNNRLRSELSKMPGLTVEELGGAVYLKGENAQVNNTNFEKNNLYFNFIFSYQNYDCTSYAKGAALYVDGTVDISNSYFKSNTIEYAYYSYGSAVYINTENGYDSIINSEFSNNYQGSGSQQYRGGAVYATSYDGDIINSTFKNNDGGEAVELTGDWNIFKSTFINNPYGAVKSNSKGNVNYNIFVGNTQNSFGRISSYITSNSNVNVDYNWWGDNTNPQAYVEGTICNNWLCSNLIIDDLDMETPIIYTKLNSLSDGTVLSDEDYAKVPIRPVTYTLFGKGTLSSKNSDTSNYIAYLNGQSGSEAKITSTVDNQQMEITKYNQEIELKLSTLENDALRVADGVYGQLANKINNAESGSTVTLTQNYIYQNISSDTPYINGIPINKPLTIEGNGIIIDANNKAGFFNITSDNVIINNITFKNAKNTAINWNGNNGILNNTIFTSNNERLINWEGNNNAILNSIFTENLINNTDDSYSGICYYQKDNYGLIHQKGDNNLVYNSNFTNNKVLYRGWSSLSEIAFYGGVIYIEGDRTIIESNNFNNNCLEMEMIWSQYYTVQGFGGAIYLKGEECKINNTNFIKNHLYSYFKFSYQTYADSFSNGGAVYVDGTVDILDSYFESNYVNDHYRSSGGAVYINSENGYDSIVNSEFLNNYISSTNGVESGSAVYVTSFDGDIINSTFKNNQEKKAVVLSGEWNIFKSTFINNLGGAIELNSKGKINYNIFVGNTQNSFGRISSYITANSNVNVDYNWWGNNTTPQALIEGTICNNWLCSNLIIDDSDKETPIIYTKLNSLSDGTVLSDEYYAKVPIRPVTYTLFGKGSLSSMNSDTSNYITYLNGQTGTYEVKITSTVDNQKTEITNSIDVVKIKQGSFTDLQKLIMNSKDILNLTRDYTYDSTDDENMEIMFNIVAKDGIEINNKLTINGNGFKVDGANSANLFKISSKDVTLNNITLTNAALCPVYIDSGANVSLINNKEISNTNNPIIIAKGGLFLENNSFINQVDITQGGTIYSATNTIILDGKDSYLTPQKINLYATLTDDNNNVIKVSDFRFVEGNNDYLAHLENNKYIYNDFILNNSETHIFTLGTSSKLINNKITSGKIISNVVDIHLNLDKDSIKFKEVIVATISLDSSNVTGTVSLLIDNIEQKVFNVNDGEMILELKELSIGKHTITAIYGGDDHYKSTTTSKEINVDKWDTQITTDTYVFTYGDKLIIEASVANEDATGNITLTVNKVEYTENINNKKAIFEIPTINAGVYEFNVRYNGNVNYNSASIDGAMTINKMKEFNMEVSYAPTEIIYGNQIIMDVTFDKDVSGKVSLDIDGSKYVETISNNKATFTLNNLNAKHYVLTPIYSGDINFESKNATVDLIVNQANSNINVVVKNNITYGEIATIEITSNVDGNAKINVGSFEKIVDVVNKKAVVEIPDLDANDDSYSVEVLFYDPNANYKNSTGNSFLKVNKAKPTFNINIDDINYKEIATLNADFANDIRGYADIIISDGNGFELKFSNVGINNGTYSQELNNLDSSRYTVSFEFKGSNNYDSTIANKSFNVGKIDPTADIKVTNATYGQSAKIIININAEGNLTINIGSVKNYNDVLINNNLVDLNIENIDAGTYNVKVTYNGNKNYNIKTYDSQLTINKKPTNIIATVDDIHYSQVATINVKANVDGVAVVKVGDNYIQNINVIANTVTPVNFDNIPAGKYNVSVVLKPTSKNHDESNFVAELTVSKKGTSVNLNVEDVTYGTETIVKVTASEDGKIILNIGDITRERNVLANTMTQFNLGILSANSYDVRVEFDAGENYKTSSNNTKLIINPKNSNIVASSVTTVYNGGKYLVATLTDNEGNAIAGQSLSINLNGIKSATTDSNGKIKLTTNGLVPKTYTATITFNGNNYTKSTVNVNVVVKKATPKLTAKAKTFKRTLKTKKYTITLKTNQNKVMKNTKVTIKVNKKTYTAKTNSKGVATFKITKLTKKGTFKAIITYKGNSYYNKVTKKVNIKCK